MPCLQVFQAKELALVHRGGARSAKSERFAVNRKDLIIYQLAIQHPMLLMEHGSVLKVKTTYDPHSIGTTLRT